MAIHLLLDFLESYYSSMLRVDSTPINTNQNHSSYSNYVGNCSIFYFYPSSSVGKVNFLLIMENFMEPQIFMGFNVSTMIQRLMKEFHLKRHQNKHNYMFFSIPNTHMQVKYSQLYVTRIFFVYLRILFFGFNLIQCTMML